MTGVMGSGGMGTVYRATDRTLQREVAIKVTRAADPAARDRFLREARTLAAMSHPHVVPVLDAGHEGEDLYLVMDLVPGGSIENAAKLGQPSTADILDWTSQVAAALDAVHEMGLVHRDVKPGNVFLGPGGAMLGDFGLARSTARGQTITEAGSVMGTPGYMAPELFEGQPGSAASDQYALAVMAFELLAGRRPHVAAALPDLIRAQMREEATRLASLRPDLPDALDFALARALDRRSEARFLRCGDLARAMKKTVPGSAVTGVTPRRPVPALARAVAVAVAAAAAMSTVPRSPEHLPEEGAPVVAPAPDAIQVLESARRLVDEHENAFTRIIEQNPEQDLRSVILQVDPQWGELQDRTTTALVAAMRALDRSEPPAPDLDWLILTHAVMTFITRVTEPIQQTHRKALLTDGEDRLPGMVATYTARVRGYFRAIANELNAMERDEVAARHMRRFTQRWLTYNTALADVPLDSVLQFAGDKEVASRAFVSSMGTPLKDLAAHDLPEATWGIASQVVIIEFVTILGRLLDAHAPSEVRRSLVGHYLNWVGRFRIVERRRDLDPSLRSSCMLVLDLALQCLSLPEHAPEARRLLEMQLRLLALTAKPFAGSQAEETRRQVVERWLRAAGRVAPAMLEDPDVRPFMEDGALLAPPAAR